jgi:hypothetical protein
MATETTIHKARLEAIKAALDFSDYGDTITVHRHADGDDTLHKYTWNCWCSPVVIEKRLGLTAEQIAKQAQVRWQ